MIFAVFDPSPLTVCINCSSLHLLYLDVCDLYWSLYCWCVVPVWQHADLCVFFVCAEADWRILCQITFCAANTQKIDTNPKYDFLLVPVSHLCICLGPVVICILALKLTEHTELLWWKHQKKERTMIEVVWTFRMYGWCRSFQVFCDDWDSWN